tara:strand:- start:113033 stop:114190 length:1158 start_codon:yes stop_codon:yes gene_type:complete
MTDYLHLNNLLGEENVLISQALNEWVAKNMRPEIENWSENKIFPRHLMKEFASMGAVGSYIPSEYGGHGMDQLGYGLVMREIERCDSGLRSFASVQSSLVMYPILAFGSEEQRQKYLPKLATTEFIGSFGLTEPNHGSNPGGMLTHYKSDGDDIILNGSKMWITNSPICDVALVWAKDESGRVHGVLVDRGLEGFSTPKTDNKLSLRASETGELVFDNVRISKKQILPGKSGLGAPLKCLDAARYGIAWGAIGAAEDCYETALKYAQERIQFDKPIASFQLIQKKLAEMVTEITKAQLLAYQVGNLRNEGKATSAQISMAKRNNVDMALKVARESRQILGAMGISQDYSIMRHMMNLESVITYEGTHDIHLLITGMDITGIAAFK